MKLNEFRGCLIGAGLGAAGLILVIVAAGVALLLSNKTNTPPAHPSRGTQRRSGSHFRQVRTTQRRDQHQQ